MGGLTLLCMITRIAMSGCSPWFNEWIDMCGYGIGAEGFIVVIGCVLHPSCDISRIFLTVSGMSGVLDFTENSLAWAVMHSTWMWWVNALLPMWNWHL